MPVLRVGDEEEREDQGGVAEMALRELRGVFRPPQRHLGARPRGLRLLAAVEGLARRHAGPRPDVPQEDGGVLGDMARDRISGSSIERVLTSDTVPMAHGPKVDCVSVGDLLGHAVQRIHDGESVSSLFDI